MTIAWRDAGAGPAVRSRPAADCRPRGYRGKRTLDVTVAAVLLLVLLPLLVGVALLVRATSRGPAVFRQERVGHDQRRFVIHKFRTMRLGASDEIHRAYVRAQFTARDPRPADAVHKLGDDPRVTPLGRWLRRTSIDELPQLWDVLRGHMSLVGPRPMLAWEAELLDHRARDRFLVRPGITGLWQVSGRSRLTMPQACALDVQYAHEVALATDLRILLKTLVVVLHPGGSAR